MQADGLSSSLIISLPWLDQLLLVAASSARFAFAFIFVPLFSPQTIPPTVRNSLIITFGMVAYALQTQFIPRDLSAAGWAFMLLKEAAAGTIIGFFFGSVLWALGAAGELIDTKVGATMGQLVDPLTGSQTSLTGILLSRFGQITFVMAGGLTLLVGTVMESYAVWPMGPAPLNLESGSVAYFEGEFGRMFMLSFLFAAPVLTVLYVIDAGMGLLNRFAQQFNVFSLSMPIKAAAAIFVLILILPLLTRNIQEDLDNRGPIARGILENTAGPSK